MQLKGNNARFVSSENGTMPLTCNRVIGDLWETFTWAENGVAFRSASTNIVQISSPIASDDFGVYPLSSKNFRVALPVGTTALRIIDYSGRQIKVMQVKGKRMVDVDVNAAAGVYIIQALTANKMMNKKVVVQ